MANLPGTRWWRAPGPGRSNLHFFQRNAVAAGLLITYICLKDEEKDAEEADNKAACELHTGMSCVGVAFLFPGEDLTKPSPISAQDRQEVTLSSQ